jgi:hypothetical protein
MNKQEIYESVMEWQMEAGESFTDYFNSDIHPLTYMSWCLGRGYLSPEKYNMWAKAYRKNELEATDPNYFVYNEYGDEDAMFAVVVSEDFNEEDFEKAFRILAEFISEIDIYQDRLKRFLADN